VLALSRQALPMLPRPNGVTDNPVSRGAYLVIDPGQRDVTLIATGSEVSLVLEAARKLEAEGVKAAVVSAPCFELFAEQDDAYRSTVLGTAPRIGVEAARDIDWRRWIGDGGAFVGMTGFGASAPAPVLYQKFGITADAVTDAAKAAIARSKH
jgi:transketolase